jgi:hypothetical protein
MDKQKMDLVCQLNQIGTMICKIKDEKKLKTIEKHINKLHSELKNKKTKKKRKRKQTSKSKSYSFDIPDDSITLEEPVISDKPVTLEQPVISDKPVTLEQPVISDKSVTLEQPVMSMSQLQPVVNSMNSEDTSDKLMLEDIDKGVNYINDGYDSFTRRYG